MSVPSFSKRKKCISLLKRYKESLLEKYWHNFVGEKSKGIKFYERNYSGIDYLITESFYPKQPKPFFSTTVIIQIPYSEIPSINSSIRDEFEESIFGKPVREVDNRVADELDYEAGLAGETVFGEEYSENVQKQLLVEPKEKVQFPFFEAIETIEEAEDLAKELIDLYRQSKKKSRNKTFKDTVKNLLERKIGKDEIKEAKIELDL
ncbi:MAG: hypothetical protein QMD12_01380 [Candidatus Aenigmarchaeota archaeon]|nr:hypothetical protein [Candidatus Aenigmarchaeota archaeon]